MRLIFGIIKVNALIEHFLSGSVTAVDFFYFSCPSPVVLRGKS